MQIKLNGQAHCISGNYDLLKLINELKVQTKGLIVELNGQLYSEDGLSSIQLRDGDVVELIHYMGGG